MVALAAANVELKCYICKELKLFSYNTQTVLEDQNNVANLLYCYYCMTAQNMNIR